VVVTPQRVVEREDGRSGSRRALRARADSRRGRRGRPVLQQPVLGAADSERRNCSRVLGVLSDVPEAISHQGSGSQRQRGAARICAGSNSPPVSICFPIAGEEGGQGSVHWRQ